jgi:hypothetical protein
MFFSYPWKVRVSSKYLCCLSMLQRNSLVPSLNATTTHDFLLRPDKALLLEFEGIREVGHWTESQKRFHYIHGVQTLWL